LLGPSGGGKSTLLRIIGGLEQPDAGSVQIDGMEATGVPAQRRNVGFVFQHYAAFKHLSVYRNVAFGLEIRKRPKNEIRRRVGSPEQLYDRPANEFVMGFLGPVTKLGGRLVRPHDIEVFAGHVDGAIPAEITRLQRIGFEVRAELRAGASEPWVQLTRGQAEGLELATGSSVWLRAAPHAAAVSLQGCGGADLGEDGLRGAGVAEPGSEGA